MLTDTCMIFLISWEYLGYSNKVIRWLYEHFPQPDIPVILWCDPRIAFNRKRDTHLQPLDFYVEQARRYLLFVKKKKIRTVNTKKGVDTTVYNVLRIINQKLVERLKLEDKILILLSLLKDKVEKEFSGIIKQLEKM